MKCRFIAEHNVGQEIVTDQNLLRHFSTKCSMLGTVVWSELLRNMKFLALQL
jgi:hypothetical protein